MKNNPINLRGSGTTLVVDGRVAVVNWGLHLRGDYWSLGITWQDSLFSNVWIARMNADGGFDPVETALSSRGECPMVSDCFEQGRRSCHGCPRDGE